LDKPHILALAAETGFLLFKEQVPLKFIKEISADQCEKKTFRLIPLSTPVNFRWTVPLMLSQLSKKWIKDMTTYCYYYSNCLYCLAYNK
jgi:hypothetical protein